MTALVVARNLERIYEVPRGFLRERGRLRAVSGISFEIAPGRTLGVVGESGCGKSTLARLVTLIEKPSAGTLMLDGIDAIDPPRGEVRRLRRTVQLVFQNPYGSLNPRKKIGSILEEPLVINTDLRKEERTRQAVEMLAKVGLRLNHYGRYPHMFSGGQRQRIAIARALLKRPKVLIFDEATSNLDQHTAEAFAQTINQLKGKVTMLFIAHNLPRGLQVDEVMQFGARPAAKGGAQGAMEPQPPKQMTVIEEEKAKP